jgi:hypothetical protein
MRVLLTCNGCKTSSVASCDCPTPEEHLEGCPFNDFGAALRCPPGSGCCAEDHSHDAAANACPGAGSGHAGAACPAPDSCIAVTPAGQACPGGHCAKGVPGCTVCRPITITVVDLGVPAGTGG